MPEFSDSLQDDEIMFADEDDESSGFQPISANNERWKVIISDDEVEVHNVTTMVLKNTIYEGKELEFLHAYSGHETLEIVEKNPDAALLLLDVVMEEDDTGLKVIKEIRQKIDNKLIRIVIRTGQPGEAPERKVIVDYDINDYKEKTELTSQKLFSTVIASLRSFDNLMTINNTKRGIELVLRASNKIYTLQTVISLSQVVLEEIENLIAIQSKNITNPISGFIGVQKKTGFKIKTGLGKYSNSINRNIRDFIEEDLSRLKENEFSFKEQYVIVLFRSITGQQLIIYFDCAVNREVESLLNIFRTNIINTFNKICLMEEIENTQKEVLFTLGEVVETRSNETGFHVKRVAEYSHLLALKYGLSPEEAEILRQASPMHDVGKVGILDNILNKPGKLTPGEFEIMKTHTTIGYDIFKNSNRRILKAAAIIALQHHERFNGTGYPQRLKGSDIHIYGRITCLSDVFDALGSERVYKQAWELDKIIDFLKQERGNMFDPELLDIFFENLTEILTIRESLKDE